MNIRWRGHLNWKDIVERLIPNIITGVVIGGTLFVLGAVF